MHSTIGHHVRYMWYLLAGASSLPALRLGKHWWETDYSRGGLARTDGDIELPRHLLVAALVRHYAPGGDVLDIGCGTGGLTIPLRNCFGAVPNRYVGLDYSELALRTAAARAEVATAHPGSPTPEFVQGDFDEYRPNASYDAIIFSESLYYSADALRTVQRYLGSLREGGIVVISMWRRPSRVRVWRTIRSELREQSRSRITVPRRPAWDIVVYGRR